MQEYFPRIIQMGIALIMLILACTRFSRNHIGQNMINFTTVGIFVAGFDNIIMPYRCYLNKQAFEYEATFVIFALLYLAVLFEKFNRTPGYFEPFNSTCYVIDFAVLVVNFLYIIAMLVTLAAYAIRHIYRLMTERLLTNNANLQRHEIEGILNMRKPFIQILRQKPLVNTQCSICFLDFQMNQNALLLPGCDHCFHTPCIEEWLNQKATCPNCRSNLRLNVL